MNRSIRFDPALPISARREEIRSALERHPVVVVCGETGSGKTTQLPKILLEMGFGGRRSRIGHTQPRRIAARSVAARIAEELGAELGGLVGYKVRFQDRLRALAPPGGAAAPLVVPLAIGGLGQRGVSALGNPLASAGLRAVQAGAAGKADLPTPALEPGSAIGLKLIRGDVDFTATGTVTWVDGNSILAFGHPFLSMGPVDMPMARAEVLTVLPSLYRSFKFSSTGPRLGSVSQDRSTGILGSFGKPPTMVPVTIKMTSEEVPTQTFQFEVVHNSMLTPILLALATSPVPAQQPGDPDAGADVFDTYCSDCHSLSPTGRNRKGPTLLGVMGRRAGTAPGFGYSPAMVSSGIVWNPGNLSAYLADPRGVVPGGKMKDKLTKVSDRANVIAYLANPD